MAKQGDLITDVSDDPKPPAKRKPKAEVPAVQDMTPMDRIMSLAADPNFDADKLQKLIDMSEHVAQRQAKEEFDRHFALMQAEFRPVEKSKKGDKGKYAPLEELQAQFDPIIHAHGFSYRWSERRMEDGWLGVEMVISGHGHAETVTKAVPPYEPDKISNSEKRIMNSLQAEGTRSSYLYRYVYRAGFGIVIKEEDTDGSFEDGVYYGQEVQLLRESKTRDELMVNYKTVMASVQNDKRGKELLIKIAEKRKKELANG